MPTKSATATIRSRYAEQAASDLGENRQQQQKLVHQLEVLKQEEALLLDILRLAEDPAALPEEHAPAPRQTSEEPALPAGDRTSATGRITPDDEVPSPRSAARRVSRTRTAGKAAKPAGDPEKRQPLLREILLDLLSAYDEPRLAAELREELLEKHPDRRPTPQVVRNTLETLVAKGCIERHKQNRTVMYTVTGPAEEATSDPQSTAVDDD